MEQSTQHSVCIIGAGSMGIITGYHLQLAGADITFLARSHHEKRLAKPQQLYSYDDHSLKTYQGYNVITEPARLADTAFRFIIITLDSASLRAPAGLKLVDELGGIYKNTSTTILLGSVGIGVRDWFLDRSGLAQGQVINAGLGSLAYEVPAVELPLHPGVKPELLAQADYGYRHLSPYGFMVAANVESVAQDFSALYNQNGVVQCGILPPSDWDIQVAIIVVIMAWYLLNYAPLAGIDSADETWELGVAAMKEFQGLSLFGQKGQEASQQTNAEGVMGLFRQLEQLSLPLDFAGFNKYHHGGKVNSQDVELLRDALTMGEAAGTDMPALRALVDKLPQA